MRYSFEWDIEKEKQNRRRHRISFVQAATVFQDPNQMKAEYDFSKGERGKFYRADAVFQLPIYLEKDVDEFMRHLADAKGKDIGELVNEVLRRNIQLIQSIQ